MRIADIGRIILRRIARHTLQLIVLLACVFLAIILGFTAYAIGDLPDLQPWHTERLSGEFSALLDSNLDFQGYMAQEEKLFAAARARAATWRNHGEGYIYSRFNPDAPWLKLAEGDAPYNRSFRLSPREPRGMALLVHGLTDSPYSMKALAEVLFRQGFEVTVLRLPGHGTFPSMMTEMRYRDWKAAVNLAVRDVAKRRRPGQPFYLGGYSTGATLVLTYALDALTDAGLHKPDRVLLISPAIELTRVAALANVIDVLSVVPIPILEKVRWQHVVAEYDPYKFNSFPVNAARQVNRATDKLQEALKAAAEGGQLAGLPPVVAWQSVVDATVGSSGSVDLLFPQLTGGSHRLILFDVNRFRALEAMQRPTAGEVIRRAVEFHPGYVLEVVSNASPDSDAVVVSRYAPGTASPLVEPLDLEWPGQIISLGHVALPFPPDDPVYGFRPGSGRAGVPSIGSWLLKGENGALTISLGSLTRLRSNPFWDLIERQVTEIVALDLAVQARQ